MEVISTIPDFGLSTELAEAEEHFGVELEITAYVEGFDDVAFWTEEFLKQGLTIQVEPISSVEKANGKGAILAALKENRIILGKAKLVCIDSDYDYLLGTGDAPYESDFCFQTYKYSIENYYFHPEGLMRFCFKATNNYQGLERNLIVDLLQRWSNHVFISFVNRFHDNDNCDEYDGEILEALKKLSIDDFDFNEISCTDADEGFIKMLEGKGLRTDNVFEYFRGHDLESKLSSLLNEVVDKLINIAKEKIEMQHQGDKANQLKAEYFNKRKDVIDLVKTREKFPESHCYSKLIGDINSFKRRYTPPVSG
ncbi:DUF4435 domain-containing protein [Photobacterium atrarenae]|uniref:DUF4435 domain-containing protein n=1 Tax=Photobacterium atrarenae TaxID=865757 RepID=A0ABY5GBE5_9GAMM|nr:DUF4435 domain-containing protein [Photobacterium atrarenae]UTV26399.1 DUF4435 domain-containing protein [Photobacterium atrarenae]